MPLTYFKPDLSMFENSPPKTCQSSVLWLPQDVRRAIKVEERPGDQLDGDRESVEAPETAVEQTPVTPTPQASLEAANVVRIFDPEQVQKRMPKPAFGMGKEKERHPTRFMLQRMLEEGPQRVLATVDDTACKRIKNLKRTFPNFSEFLEFVEKQMCLARRCDPAILYLPPVCLLGPPGIGKTAVLRRVLKILGLPFNFVSCPELTASFVLSGGSSQWSAGSCGSVARALIDGDTANSCFILDEIDKLPLRSNHPPDGSLYRLLERSTARTFRDEFLEIDLDASHLLWLTTANETLSIPTAIQSRLQFVNVRAPKISEMEAVIDSVNEELREEVRAIRESFAVRLPDAIKDLLVNHAPRELKRVLLDAYGNAAMRSGNGRKTTLLPRDVSSHQRNGQRNPIGFAS